MYHKTKSYHQNHKNHNKIISIFEITLQYEGYINVKDKFGSEG